MLLREEEVVGGREATLRLLEDCFECIEEPDGVEDISLEVLRYSGDN